MTTPTPPATPAGPELKRATAPAVFKALDDDTTGQPSGRIRAVVSVFGNVDFQGDRVLPGAFADTLAEWQRSGDPIPFIWSHMWDNPDAHIGVVTAARETAEGLEVDAQVDLDHPFAARVYTLLAQRRVTQFSFGYYPVDYAWTSDDVRELRRVDLFEVGPTLRGMNDRTRLVAAASATSPVADLPPTPAPAADPAPPAADPVGGCDSGGTIDQGRLADLLTMTRNKES